MIFGVGTDIVAVARLGKLYERHGEHALGKLLAPAERDDFERAADPARFLAKRFAAKEACSKALGTGLAMGISWRDMAVQNLPSGQPTMTLTGWAAERLTAMTPPGHSAHIHVTLTDDHPWAQAFVVIEALPDVVKAPAGA